MNTMQTREIYKFSLTTAFFARALERSRTGTSAAAVVAGTGSVAAAGPAGNSAAGPAGTFATAVVFGAGPASCAGTIFGRWERAAGDGRGCDDILLLSRS